MQSFPLSIELQEKDPICFVQYFEQDRNYNIHYTIKKIQQYSNQSVILEFYSYKTQKKIGQQFILDKENHRVLYVHQKREEQVKMCLWLNVGKIELQIHIKSEPLQQSIPTRTDSNEISAKIEKKIQMLKSLQNRMSDQIHQEQREFNINLNLDKKIISLTLIQTIIIIATFIIEYMLVKSFMVTKYEL